MELLIILVLALLNGLLAMSELAVVSSKKGRLELAARDGLRGANTALRLRANPDVFLPTVQVGITLVGTVAGAYGGNSLIEPLEEHLRTVPYLEAAASPLAFLVVVGGITYINLVLGELVPKRLALRSPEGVARRMAPPLAALGSLLRPATWFLGFSTGAVLRVFGIGEHKDAPLTEEEIQHMLSEGTRAGVLEAQEEKLLRRVLSLDEQPGPRLMCPRNEVVWLDVDASSEENLRRIRSCPHARFPVCQGNLDQPLGVIGTKELFCHTTMETGEFKGLTDELRPPLLLPEHLTALEILERFRTAEVHLGLVVDEYGSVQGLITDNDLLQAIVGEMPEDSTAGDEMIVRREDGSLLLDGALGRSVFRAYRAASPSQAPVSHAGGSGDRADAPNP